MKAQNHWREVLFPIGLLVAGIFIIVGTGCAPRGANNPADTSPKTTGLAPAGSLSFDAIKPVLQGRCQRCHDAKDGKLNWMDETILKDAVARGVLEKRLSNKTMPQVGSPEAGALTDKERDLILTWAKSLTEGTGAGPAVTVMTVDMIKDRQLAFLNRCAACHGLNGVSINGTYPNLYSSSKDFMVTRLQSFLDPAAVGTMPDQLKMIADDFGLKISKAADGTFTLSQDGNALLDRAVEWFSRQGVPATSDEVIAARKKLSAEDLALYNQGKDVFANNSCGGCHMTNELKPLSPQPMVLGQKKEILALRFTEFKARKWGAVMPDIVPMLSDADINAVIVYISNTHPAELTQVK